jgi:hypothetical protein
LEHARDGQALRLEPDHGRPHLAGFCPPAAPGRGLKLSKDPLFIEKVRDIVGLYLNPPDKALILCVDERRRFRFSHQQRQQHQGRGRSNTEHHYKHRQQYQLPRTENHNKR